MAISIKDIAWLAGLLEGEGSFGLTNNGKSPAIWLQMTDSDIVERARALIDPSKSISLHVDNRKDSYKDVHRITFNGARAVGWMMTVYPLMGVRRQAKIRECLTAWKAHEIDTRFVNSQISKDKRSLTGRLKKMGYAEHETAVAGVFKDSGFSDEEIILKLNEMRSTTSESSKNLM